MPPRLYNWFSGAISWWIFWGKNWTAKKLIVTRVTRVIGPEGTPAPPRNKGNPWFSKAPWEVKKIWKNMKKWCLETESGILLEAGKMPMQLFQSTNFLRFLGGGEHQKINWGWSWKRIPHYGMKERRILKLFWKPDDHFQGFCVETFGGFCGEISTQCITSAIIEDRPPSWYSNCKDSMVSTVIINRWHQDSPKKKKTATKKNDRVSSIEKTSTMCFFGTASK